MTQPPEEWLGQFDLVVEIHILQAIQIEARIEAAKVLPKFLRPSGRIISIGRELTNRVIEISPPPWPLARTWLMEQFSSLEKVLFQPIILDDWPDIDRYIGVWKRPENKNRPSTI